MLVKPKDEHTYRLRLDWEGDPEVGTSDYQVYDRAYRISMAGKPALSGSADPAFRGNPARHNPEDLLLAALSACHMLSYLALCARRGVTVLEYSDEAEAVLTLTADGGGHFASATLHPRVRVAAPEQAPLARELHALAHETCFIASSCNFPVRHESTVVS
jgi:organic hydroperoxide reductase OsmC/OhrA